MNFPVISEIILQFNETDHFFAMIFFLALNNFLTSRKKKLKHNIIVYNRKRLFLNSVTNNNLSLKNKEILYK